MKRVLTFILLISFSVQYAAGQEKTSPQALHDTYMEQAKKKRIIGWTMFGTGMAMTLGGVAKSMAPGFEGVPKTDPRLLWLPVVGILTTLGSFPMLSNANKLERKGEYYLRSDNAFTTPGQRFVPDYPAIGVRFRIR